MRIWSIHPKHLDRQGLLALWREGLLAQKVIAGKTRGYRHHPQLRRFQEQASPLVAIACCLHAVCDEAEQRDYHFSRAKIVKNRPRNFRPIPVTRGQIEFERKHLLRKLRSRSPEDGRRLAAAKKISLNPVFRSVPGPLEEWEKI